MKKILILVFLTSLAVKINAQVDKLNVITGQWLEYSNSRNSLYDHITNQAYDQLEKRAEKISEIKSSSGWEERQEFIRKTLAECNGPFPEKTPLNARITRTIQKDGYRVEHIVFESIPGFYVTSSLYIPTGIKRNEKLPAIIYCSGHSADGYRSDVYQHVILNLVKKRFIVFAFDPVGQGERLEYFDKGAGKSIIGGPTSEHSYPGAQAFITGSSEARYMIWDGIRSVDYLLSRKDVDPSRIGITGRSGGGTQSAYIAAYDDRIYAAAPENYITNYKRLLQTIGPQDAEQNIFNIISKGLDHPDFLIVRAPKPALMITTTGDMFSIQGAMETEKEVSLVYKAFGKPENFTRCEDEAPHASTRKNREAMYSFFMKHLRNPGNNLDEEVKLLSKEELMVTKTGQVSTSLGGETVFSLNLKEASQIVNKRESAGNQKINIVNAARELSGYMDPAENDDPVFTGRIIRKDYCIDKYFVKGEGEYVIPYLLFKPAKSAGKVMIYLNPSGKSAEAKEGGEIETFVKQGITVLAPDLIGTGEIGPGDLRGDANFKGASHNLWYASMLIGRSITGIQSADVVKLARLIKSDQKVTELTGFGRESMATVLLHAAVFSDDFNNIILAEPYSSFMAIVRERFYNPLLILSTVPGAISKYDLPLLASACAPNKLFITGATDGSSGYVNDNQINSDLQVIEDAYRNAGAADMLIITGKGEKKINYEMMMKFILGAKF